VQVRDGDLLISDGAHAGTDEQIGGFYVIEWARLVRAHRATVAAAEATGVPAKLYFTAVPRSAVARLRASLPADEARATAAEMGPDFGTPDDRISTRIDVSAYVARKRAALHAYASQTRDFFLLRLPDELLDVALGAESFVRRRPASTPGELEDDLFSGLR
jgi:LmbE family N-acetylglucosaminyl deacetylase